MSSHLSKTEYEIMEYFWGMGDKYTFGELSILMRIWIKTGRNRH